MNIKYLRWPGRIIVSHFSQLRMTWVPTKCGAVRICGADLNIVTKCGAGLNQRY